ncbi:MAG: hypothetical protein DRH30_07920 [Deltaproteobacteria bacterium]|nr:MAG: hypothetical protein DRH30_07920 [Deltaproteobacteria bacterium]
MTSQAAKAKKKAKSTTRRKTAKRTGSIIHKTREAWLESAIQVLRPEFARAQRSIRVDFPKRYSKIKCTLPKKLKITCGWPSHRGTASRRRVLGQCWNPVVSTGKHTEIFISPFIEKSSRVLDIILHELIHAAIGTEEGHKHMFKTVMIALGLEGKPTATVASEELEKHFRKVIIPQLGKYPHKKMDVTEYKVADKPKTQGTRMIKVACKTCEYTVRTTQKWIDIGLVTCPNPECDDYQVEMEAHAPRTRGTGRPTQ